MLQLGFSGWFQCRLATDPDPTDEPRGVSGWTFSLAGEPDFDRIIRTQPGGATARVLGPKIGVAVDEIIIDGQAVAQHALHGAPVTLLSNPVFEGRNGLAAEDTEEPIFPFHVCIEANGIRVEREFRELDSGEWRFQKSVGAEANFQAMNKAGIADPQARIADRKSGLEQRLAQATDALERLQLETRLRHLRSRNFGPVPMFVGLRHRYRLEGPWFMVRDRNRVLGGTIDGSPWLLSAWTGCWDADALCGFMSGSLLLPFQPEIPQA